jgi:beta-glucosidase
MSTYPRCAILQVQAETYASCVCLLLLFMGLCSSARCQAPVPDSPAVEARVSEMLGKLTLDEKLAVIGGDQSFFIRALPSIGMPALKMSDGPYGVRTFGRSTAYAAGISLAAAWDPELARRVGAGMGRDARARGVHFLLAPGVNIYRSPLNGRNFEYAGEDPFLAARTAVGFVEGVQGEGVIATVKHFAANNSEFDRHNINSIVDERTLREIYLPAFEASVKEAHVGAVMDSYNLLNGEHLTQNSAMNNDLLKKEWKFDGVLMSDWSATYDTAGAVNGGLDLEMPSGKLMNPTALKAALAEGKISQAMIDEKVRRILRTAVRFSFFDRPQLNTSISAYDSGGDEIAYEAALSSIALLRNENATLPLDAAKVHTIAVIGPDADPVTYGGGGSSLASPLKTVSIMDGLAQRSGPKVKVLYSRGVMKPSDVILQTRFDKLTQEMFSNVTCTGTPRSTGSVDRISDWSPNKLPVTTDHRCVRWTGTYTPLHSGSYTVLAAAAFRDAYHVRVDGNELIRQERSEDQSPNSAEITLRQGVPARVEVEYIPDADANRLGIGVKVTEELIAPEAKAIAAQADAVVLSVGYGPDTEGESHDRTYELPFGQAELIREIGGVNAKTIVAVTSGGAYATVDWLKSSGALVQTWYFGQEGGRALADVLFGHSPEGKLPISFERRWEDNPTHDNYYPQEGAAGPKPSVAYKEGLFVGYRYYTSMEKPVLYPFGYGLSYTKFRFDHLHVNQEHGTADSPWTVEFDVTNTGTLAGAEVAQLYVGAKSPRVTRPVRELKGFQKLHLAAGETQHVSLKLNRRSFSYFDVATKRWKSDAGSYRIQVGDSSIDLPLETQVTLD